MQINLSGGKARVKLTKSEVSTLRKAEQILHGLGKFAPDDVSGDYLSEVLANVDGDGVFDMSTDEE